MAGILVALAVDGWRQEREELRITNGHLSDLAAEVHQNLWTIDRVLNMMLARKRAALETVLAFLKHPEAPVPNVEKLLMAFAQSDISGAYAAPEVPLSQIARLKSNFEDLLKSLAPWDHAAAASALPE